jgi:hemin uptake protein HemP
MRIIIIQIMFAGTRKNVAEATAVPSPPSAALRVSSRELFRGRRELVIEHQGQEYRLKLTRNDKLILNK